MAAKQNKILISVALALLIALAAIPALHTSAYGRTLVPVVPDMPFVHIENAGVILYERHEGVMRPLTGLPQTYFAHVVAESGEFFEVIFYDLRGFVRQSAVTKVDFEPVTKFATGRLEVMRGGTVPIFARPTHLNASAIHYTPRGAEHVFYGTLNGSIPYRDEDGFSWFFIRFTNAEGNAAFGYIHASNVTASAIPPNVIEKVMVYANDPPTFTPPDFEFPGYLTIVFIVALSIPAVLVMILLFKKPKGKQEPQRVPRSF